MSFLGFMQLEASTNQELNQRIPLFNLPSKILCRVLHVQLLVFFSPSDLFIPCFYVFLLFVLCIVTEETMVEINILNSMY